MEVRHRSGYDRTLCDPGVLVSAVDQTPFRRAPVHIFAADGDGDPPRRNCASRWNATLDTRGREQRALQLTGLRIEVVGKLRSGAYRIRVATTE